MKSEVDSLPYFDKFLLHIIEYIGGTSPIDLITEVMPSMSRRLITNVISTVYSTRRYIVAASRYPTLLRVQ